MPINAAGIPTTSSSIAEANTARRGRCGLLHDLRPVAELGLAPRCSGNPENVVVAHRPAVLAAAKHLGKTGNRRGEPCVLRRRSEAAHLLAPVNWSGDKPARLRFRQLVADL